MSVCVCVAVERSSHNAMNCAIPVIRSLLSLGGLRDFVSQWSRFKQGYVISRASVKCKRLPHGFLLPIVPYLGQYPM